MKLPIVLFYYKLGHELIGSLTDSLLSDHAKESLNTTTIEEIGPWADAIRRQKGYGWTYTMHYINTGDDATRNYCHVSTLNEKTNLHTALQNYTQRLTGDTDNGSRFEDLKFFVHFYQDMFQPLHSSENYKGGNKYKVNYFGRKSNLHQVWDYLILRDRIQEFDQAADYLEYLKNKAHSAAPYKVFDIEYWIRRNNRMNCDHVYVDLNETIQPEYYHTNKYIVEDLIVQAAVNLHAALEIILPRLQT